MVPFEQALATVLAEARTLPAEEVPLEEALSRVLAEDVASDLDLPPFDRAAMDGFAVRAADVAGAPSVLEVVGEVRAGQWPESEVSPGRALRIMTGAPVPPGADAVLPVERTRPLDEFRVTALEAVPPGANLVTRGSEVRRGEVVLGRGRIVDPAALAVLASTGRSRVRVARRPLLALLVTGDEIVDASAVPGPAQVRNSNGPAVAAMARLAGADVVSLGVAPDRQDAIESALRGGLQADVLVVSGGVSAGDYDLVEPALLALGARFLFTRVAVKPGAPLVFGRLGDALVFGLPGNPVSAQVTFELFVRPALLRMQGARAAGRPRVGVELASAVRNRSGRRSHVPARVGWESGRLVARLVRSQGSGDLAAHARANALVVIGEGREHAAAGETAEALLLPSFLEDDDAPR
jgi:molybdopterin molybdotransferase